MKRSAISRIARVDFGRPRERGVTMILVAIAMVAIIAMAALSIDVTTLYLAREEAQRSADAAALAAARVISVSGITGDQPLPGDATNWQNICGAAGTATLTAQAIARQNAVNGIPPLTVTVNYSAVGAPPARDCSTINTPAFAVNPMVTVKVAQTGLPTLFSRIWGGGANSVSASATAEVFNPSSSGSSGSPIIPVQPRCVKPWVVPNIDPLNPPPNPGYCTPTGLGSCGPLVDPATGQITNRGISVGGVATGVIGETFWIVPNCQGFGTNCSLRTPTMQANYVSGSRRPVPQPNLLYVPNQVGTAVSAIPSCAGAGAYEQAVAGCDAPTNYQCGVQNANAVDLGENPATPTENGVRCLIHEGNPRGSQPDGQDSLQPYAAPSAYPFVMVAGSGNPTGLNGSPISNSTSIVSLPIYDNSVSINNNGSTTPVTFVGFLQVFINEVDRNGDVNVTVLNVSGCGNGKNATGTAVSGSSPVPIRLITPQ